MGLQSHEAVKRIVDVYNLSITPEEYMRLTGSEANKCLMAKAKLLPGIFVEGLTSKWYFSYHSFSNRRACFSWLWFVSIPIVSNSNVLNSKWVIIKMNDYQNENYRMESFWSNSHAITTISGVERLIRHLHESKVPFCLATSSSEEMTIIKSSHHKELFDHFHHKVMGSSDPEVKNGKPSPDIFLVAADRFPDKPKPENVNPRQSINWETCH